MFPFLRFVVYLAGQPPPPAADAADAGAVYLYLLLGIEAGIYSLVHLLRFVLRVNREHSIGLLA